MASSEGADAREAERAARRREQNRNAQKNLRRRKQLAKQASLEEQRIPEVEQNVMQDWRADLTSTNNTPWEILTTATIDGRQDNLFDDVLGTWTDEPIYPSPTLSDRRDNPEQAHLSTSDLAMQADKHIGPPASSQPTTLSHNTHTNKPQWMAQQSIATDNHIQNPAARRSIALSGDYLLSPARPMHDRTRSSIAVPRINSPQTRSTPFSTLTQGESSGQTCMHLAAKNGSTSLVRYFVARGMDPDTADAEGMTALHYAIHAGCEDTVNALLAGGADVELTDDNGMTALHHAVEQKQEDIAVLLIHKGADMQAIVEAPSRRIQCR